MDFSAFESRRLTLACFQPSQTDKTVGLPEAFREYFDVRSVGIDPETLRVDLAGEQYEGGIVALPVDEDDGSAHRTVQSQVDFPVEALETLDSSEEKRRYVNLVYAYDRWNDFREDASELADLLEFHAEEKLVLLAHKPQVKQDLGHMLANPPEIAFDELMKQYYSHYMNAISDLPTRARHFNVLEHLYGYLVEPLPDDELEELLETIRAFRDGDASLIEPLTLLRTHLNDYSIEWASGQSYLNPKREQLALRNELKYGG